MLPTQARWRKSSYSNGGGNCVEVAVGVGRTGVRDTKDRAGGVLVVTEARWRDFLAAAKSGSYDR
ncbi:DUF397 domain-containing protein [Saccharopolyspora sp. WRP15-2]|uniref:DUF397 domain-containing protein n=1 Tax=Saccharopolyspora oryzae TaxID=2997343 RepID=A0ABT4UYN5_9PSEU|nr:DUF397 domain-containing protein [Saccharopolyspora oryzae]MDA3626795.1 DUF397 domain-containing protein [Saccharopolyspora oryzae]